jgi:hypothetical protein
MLSTPVHTKHLSSLLDKLPSPSYITTQDNQYQIYYIFDCDHYIEDLKASFYAKYLNLIKQYRIKLTPQVNEVYALPLNSKSQYVHSEMPEVQYSTISKKVQLSLIIKHLKTYKDITSICPHVRVVYPDRNTWKAIHPDNSSHTDITRIITHKNKYPSVGFYPGNYFNTLIQLFNKHWDDYPKYIKACKDTLSDSKTRFKVVDDLINKDYTEIYKEFDSFYKGMYKRKTTTNYKTKHNKYIHTSLTPYQLYQIRRWLKTIPEYKNLKDSQTSQRTHKQNFIDFSTIIINLFYQQLKQFPDKDLYYLPSTMMKKLSGNYCQFKNILFKYITVIKREYYHGTTRYRCRAYSLNVFKLLISRILKYSKIDLSYYTTINIKGNITYNYISNYYHIFPDLKPYMESIKSLRKQDCQTPDPYDYITVSWRRKWTKIE